MPIFRYTFKKMLLTPSTWIITLLSIVFIALINVLSTLAIDNNTVYTPDEILNVYLFGWKPTIFIIFLSLMLFIFIAVKGTQVFRDEIDDGTLLILVSKPVSRTRIWTEKLFALQIMILLFMFLSIFVASIPIAIPSIGSGGLYGKMFPYLWILFGVGIIFELIVSSIAVLLSLVMNAKAIIAIMIGFAALLGMLSSILIMGLISPSSQYMIASQAAAAYSSAKSKLNASDLAWLNKYIADETNTITAIDNDLTAIYTQYIPSVSYPADYDYKLEQEYVTKIAKGEVVPSASIDVDLTKHILGVANVFRQWSQQSFRELLTGQRAGPEPSKRGFNNFGKNLVEYSVNDMITTLNSAISQEEYEDANSKLLKTKVLRYLNIFYHLKYIWDGISTPNGGCFVDPSSYVSTSDPYLFSWKKVPGTNTYEVDTSKKADSKIISFTADLTVYLIIGLILFGSSWLVFNRKDFA